LTIGVTAAGSGTDLGLRYVAAKAGFSTERDLTTMYLGGDSAMIASFTQKRIDGFVLSSPTSEVAELKFGGVKALDMNRGELEDLNGFPYLGLGAREPWLRKNPDTATRFLRALRMAEEMIQDRSDAAKSLLRSRFDGMEPAIYDAAWESTRATYPRTPIVRQEGVDRAIEMLKVTQGIVVGGAAEDYIDNTFAQKASE
jgi:NitT/TauT family transport system substrate-binding protein